MTVAATLTQTVYALAGTALGPFNTVWPYNASGDVTCQVDYGDGAGAQLLAQGADYMLVANNPTLSNGGGVTLAAYILSDFGAAWGPGAEIIIARVTPRSQPSSFGEAVGFSPQASEQALDNVERQVQELTSQMGRALLVDYGETPPVITPTDSALWGLDAAGDFYNFVYGGNPGQLIGVDATGKLAFYQPANLPPAPPWPQFATVIAAIGGQAPPATAYLSVAGYHAPGDGGAAIYVPAPAGAGPGKFQSADGQWWVLASVEINVKQFGAKGDGVADDTAACQSAVDFVAGLGGGTVHFPAGTYLISATLTVGTSSLVLSGAGAGGYHDAGGPLVVGATVLKWGGSAAVGQAMVQFAPGGTQRLSSNGFNGIYLTAGSGCSIGARLMSVGWGQFSFVGDGFSGSFVWIGVSGTISEGADTQHNVFDVAYQGFFAGGAGLSLTGDEAANVSCNIFRNITMEYNNSNAIVLVDADTNLFEMIHMYRAGGGTGTGIVLQAGADENLTARNNHFLACSPGAGGVYAEGTEQGASPSLCNDILYYDKQNACPDPTIGTGANLAWASGGLNTAFAGIGVRSQSFGATSHQTDSTGKITQWGSVSVPGSGTAVINLTPPFPNGVLALTLTPGIPAVTGYSAAVNAGLTQVTVSNNMTTAAPFWYKFEGW